MPALAFYIDAPMQSWGASSKFQHRETNSFPTKSAIVGLIAAALGIDKNGAEEATILGRIVDLKLTVARLDSLQRKSSRLSDFHTVGGGYNKQSSLREKMSIPKKASGAPFGTVITHRSYLTDAAFVVLLEGSVEVMSEVQAALLDPVWGVWFGRKACIPASPLTPTIADSRQAAFDALMDTIPGLSPMPLENMEYQEELDGTDDRQGAFYQSDQPVAFGQHHGAVPAPYRARGIVQHRPR